MDNFELEVTPQRSFFFTVRTLFPLLSVVILLLIFLAVFVVGVMSSEMSLPILMLFCFGLFGIIGLFSMFKVFIWINFGKETIKINEDVLTIRRRFSLGCKDEQYTLSAIRNLRLVNPPNYEQFENIDILATKAIYGPKFGGRVAFDVADESIFLGNFLSDLDAKDLMSEIEKRTEHSNQLIDIEQTKFNRIQLSQTNSKCIIKYSPKKDFMLIIAILAIATIWIIATILAFQNYFQNMDDSNSAVIALCFSLGASILSFLWLLYLIFGHEKLILSQKELIIKKPFNLYWAKQIELNAITKIELIEEVLLKRYWSIGKRLKNRTYTARLDDRIKITTSNNTYKFGKELSCPEGQLLKSILKERCNAI